MITWRRRPTTKLITTAFSDQAPTKAEAPERLLISGQPFGDVSRHSAISHDRVWRGLRLVPADAYMQKTPAIVR
jgi:hypothetical protein